jgi:hypothetical protein
MKVLRFFLVLSSLGLLVAAVSVRTTVMATAHTGAVVSATPMLQARSGHSATLLPDGKVLIAGGMRRNQDFYRSAELYDPASGKFQPAGEMNQARVGQAAVLLRDGKVLIAGGWIGHGSTDSAELYDPATGKFSLLGKMTAPRGRPSATVLTNGDVLLAGGNQDGGPGGVASAEVFHAGKLSFEAISPMHFGRVGHTATLLNDGRVLIAGGRGQSVTASAEIYDPARKLFLPTGGMLSARYKHTAGLLADGRVLIAGGSDERDWHGTLSSAEIYDPRTGRFTATASLHDSRFKLPDEAVQLASGLLLVAGGSKKVETYDPGTGTFLVVPGQLSDAWHFLSETRLKDGSVLMAGGYANSPEATAQAWIYRP